MNFTIKGIPDDLYAELKARASANRRSVNGEIITSLEESLRGRRVDPETMLARADAVRERIRVTPYTAAALRAAKERDRRR